MPQANIVGEYFNALAEGLAADARSSSFGGHKPDIGSNRESLLTALLNKHLPDRLRAVLGGKILNLDGDLSRQVDVIIKNDLFPRFEQHEKTCVIAEAVAGVISVKSSLDEAALVDSIENLASVPTFSPETLSLTNSSVTRPDLQSQFQCNWPFRAIFAYGGIDPDTLYRHVLKHFRSFRGPKNLLPEMIVINKKLCIRFLPDGGRLNDGTLLPHNWLHPMKLNDRNCGYPLAGMITTMNNYVPWMHYMKFNFSPYIDKAFMETSSSTP